MKKQMIIVTVLMAVFAVLSILIQNGYTIDFETAVRGWLCSDITAAKTTFFKLVTSLGNTMTVIVICIVLFFLRATRNIAPRIAAVTLISFILNITFKAIFARERPDIMLRMVNVTNYSFPSGHSTVTSAIIFTLIILLYKNLPKSKKRTILTVIFAFFIIAIGTSRIYLGVHYAGDVLCGWLLGISTAIAVNCAAEKIPALKFLR